MLWVRRTTRRPPRGPSYLLEPLTNRTSIFVDAGYLFAQGSTVLTGSTKPRLELGLNEQAVISELTDTAKAKAADCPLLRVHWYDGVAGYKGPSLDQERLAHMDNVKLRLGFINSYGQQKGVDSLIVTELARNSAISDAILLSGDEDVRIGVQVAQNFGVRVHLIGIEPSRGSQSKQLRQEVDTTTEWSKSTVEKFLIHNTGSDKQSSGKTAAKVAHDSMQGAESKAKIGKVVSEYVDEIRDGAHRKLSEHFAKETGVPEERDRVILAMCRDELGRTLDREEINHMRASFKSYFKSDETDH